MSSLAALIAPFETPRVLDLKIADVAIRVLSNDLEVHTRLSRYYAPYVTPAGGRPRLVVSLIQGRPPAQGDFRDLVRPGGRRVKEAIRNANGGRLILKRATRVLMGLLPDRAFAVGDLRTNLNQGINLINAVYAKAMLRRGHVLFHASAVSWRGQSVVLAGAARGREVYGGPSLRRARIPLRLERSCPRQASGGSGRDLGLPQAAARESGDPAHPPASSVAALTRGTDQPWCDAARRPLAS